MTKLKLLCAGVACAVWHFAVCASSYMYPTEDSWSYFPMAGCVEIQRAPVSLSGDVVVPDTLGGLPVVGIRPYAFMGCSSATRVILPDTVKEIGEGAFCNCANLRAVYLPWGLESIGEEAFYGCGLETLYLPGTLKRVGARAFENNRSLTKAVLGNGMTAIGDYMFKDCQSLTIEVPQTLETVGVKPFDGANVLSSIYFEASEEGTDKYLGRSGVCGKIQAQHPDMKFISYIDHNHSDSEAVGKVKLFLLESSKVSLSFSGYSTVRAPYGKPMAATLPVPADNGSKKFIGWFDSEGTEIAPYTIVTDRLSLRTFSPRWADNYSVKTRDDVNGVSLAYIAHDKYVEIVGYDNTVSYPESTTMVIPSEIDGLPVEVIAAKAFWGFTRLGKACLPPTLKVIGDEAFAYCYHLSKVTLPWGLETIGERAFIYTDLNTASVPGTVKEIGRVAFGFCSNLTSMVVGYGVTSLPESFTYEDPKLRSFEMPKTLESIGEHSFYCYPREEPAADITFWCEIDDENEDHNDSIDRIESVVQENNPDMYGSLRTRTMYFKLQPRMVSLSRFYSDSVLQQEAQLEYGRPISIDMPNPPAGVLGKKFVGWFDEAGREVDEDTIPSSSYNAYWAKWIDGDLPNEVVTDSSGHSQRWFYVQHSGYAEIGGVSCSSAYEPELSVGSVLEIPRTLGDMPVKVIGHSAFFRLPTNIRNVVIPDGVTAIRGYAFAFNAELEGIAMPASLRHIGYAAFSDCKGIVFMDIPGGVVSIADNAFCRCAFVSATLPGSLKYAGEGIFYLNPDLEYCYLLDGIEEIPSVMVNGSPKFSFIQIPSSVKRAKYAAFVFGAEAVKKMVVCEKPHDGAVRETDDAATKRVRQMLLRDGIMSVDYLGYTDVEFIPVDQPPKFTCKFSSKNADPSTYTVVEKNVTAGTPIGIYVPEPQDRPGYTFLGWQLGNSDRTGIDPRVPATSDALEYYARFEAQTYEVMFVMEGVQQDNVVLHLKAGSRVGALPEIGKRGGYTFGGWYTSYFGGGSQVTPDTVVTGNAYFYPYWIEDTTTLYRLVFDANGGEGSFELMRSYNEPIGDYLRTPTRTGYTFLGWYGEDIGGYATPQIPATGDATYVARWQAKNYTVRFQDDSTIHRETSMQYGAALGTLPADPVEDGKTFLGWYASGERATETTLVTGDVTYHAKWQMDDRVLTFDYNRPNGLTYQVSVTYRLPLPASYIPGASRAGYEFLGWFTKDGVSIEEHVGKQVYANETYYARWQVKRHSVTLVLNGGKMSSSTSAEYDFGSAVTILDGVPVRDGAEFLGWYTEDGVRVNGTATLPDADVKYYAHWKEFYLWQYCGPYDSVRIYNPEGGSAWIGGEIPEVLAIPSTLDNYEVTWIGTRAFEGCTGLREVEIPDGIRKIDSGAFNGCSNLVAVHLPTSVTKIASAAFAGTQLADVYVDFGYADYFRDKIKASGYDVSGVTFHETAAPAPFYDDFAIDGGLTIRCYIDGYNATIVYVPTTATEVVIPQYVESNTLPCKYNVTTIGSGSFWGLTSLQTLTIPSSVTEIVAGAFSDGMRPFAEQTLGHPVTVKVERYDTSRVRAMFTDSSHNIVNVTFSEPPRLITYDANGGHLAGTAAFIETTSYPLELGQPITYWPEMVREGWEIEGWYTDPENGVKVTDDFVPEDDMTVYAHWSLVIQWNVRYPAWYEGNYLMIDGISDDMDPELIPDEIEIPASLYDRPVKVIYTSAFMNDKSLKRVVIPDSVEEIRDNAFYGCTALEEVVLPNGLKRIGGNAFYGCTSLRSVTIPASVETIGMSAFEYCTALESVTIEEGLGGREIKRNAFEGCTSLASIVIPDGFTLAPKGVFRGCDQLADENGFVVVGGILHGYLPDGDANVVIPNGVKVIGDSVFFRRTDIASVEMPASVREIGESAFDGCTGLASVDIPDGVVSIGRGAFGGCTGITHVSIPDSVESLGWGAFDSSIYDTKTIPGLGLVDGWAVKMDSSIIGDKESLDLRGVRGIAENLFANCGYLREIWFSEDIQHIGEYALPQTLETVLVPQGEHDRIYRLLSATTSNADILNTVVVVETAPLAVVGDPEAVIKPREDASGGYAVYPSAKEGTIDISVPKGNENVEVVSPSTVSRVRAEGAELKVTNGGYDITRFLDIPDADGDGYVDIDAAQVKQMYVEGALDKESLSLDPEDPQVSSNVTVPGLVYTFYEAETLEDLAPSATKIGDGEPWNPPVNVTGGSSGFYRIGVDKR